MEEQLNSIHNEILLVGCLYREPDLYLKHGEYIRSKYDFSDEATKFYYDSFELMYKTFSQTIDEFKVDTFMTQDVERFKIYKKYGGFLTVKQWSNMADINDVENYFNIVKKWSLLREYHRNGFDVTKIINHKKFELFTAKDIYKLIRSKADKISTVILANEESVAVNQSMGNVIIDCLKVPDIGLAYPYPDMTELFRGIRHKNMVCFGMLSNEGKSRFMTKLCAYIAYFHHENVCVLLNEMTEIEYKYCLLTTVINNREFQQLHGIQVFKNEREITLGLYIDTKGDFIVRKINDKGEYLESEEDYIRRVEAGSDEYHRIMQVARWIEKQKGIIFVKELEIYDDVTLEFEIKKHTMVHGIKYFFYDTLKNDSSSIGDWASLKLTTTKLKELANQLGIYMYGSIQLSDDTTFTDIFALSSNNISNCKQLKHLLDQLCIMKRLAKDDYYKYKYIPNDPWGDDRPEGLDNSKTYYGCVIDKNRQGSKTILLFEADLNRNTWYEVGQLIKAK